MESKDYIDISDDEEEPNMLEANTSVLVIGEINVNRPKREIKKDMSIIDLTDGNDSFMVSTNSPTRSQPHSPRDSPPLISQSPSPPIVPRSPSPPIIARSPSPALILQSPSPPIISRPLSQSPPLIPPSPTPSPDPLTPRASTSTTTTTLTSSASSSRLRSSPRNPTVSPRLRQSPKKSDNRKTAVNLTKRLEREEAKRLKQIEKEKERLVKEANKANAVKKASENCTAIIDKNILTIINDPEEITFRTLFDESQLHYELTDSPKHTNSITWSCKRTEIEDGRCVAKFSEGDWIIVVMNGSDYLKRILTYRDDPNSENSLKKYICDIRRQSNLDVILLVYNLSNYLKTARQKDAKNYQKKFKDRFEGRNRTNDSNNNEGEGGSSSNDNGQIDTSSIGATDLQDLRLMLEIEIKHENQDWKFHFEFFEKTQEAVQTIARYTSSIAKYQIKRRAKALTNLDWAINMDKEKATDPTKSSDDLTKLWMTQLQQFSQITLPIAKAIAAEYPSPSALLDQYSNLTTSEAEELLARLYVQRNLKRQVGSNISRKIHCFMTSRDPDIHIGYN